MDTTTGAQKDPLYYLYDGLGSVVQLTDSTGKTADKYAFDEFGNEVAGGKQSPNAANVLHNNLAMQGSSGMLRQGFSICGVGIMILRWVGLSIGIM